MDELVERFGRWLQNTGYDGGVNSPPMLIYALVQDQAAEIRSLREQVTQERAGMVEWLHSRPDNFADVSEIADAIERHEDKEPTT